MPLEQLLSQLEVEQSATVIRRLVKLLVNSFHPTTKGVDILVSMMMLIVILGLSDSCLLCLLMIHTMLSCSNYNCLGSL